MFTGTQANGGGTIPKTAPVNDTGDVDDSQHDAFLNSQYQSKSQKRKRVSSNASEDKELIAPKSKKPIASSSKQPVASSSKKPRSSGEAPSQFQDELAIRQKTLSKTEQAISLLYADYEIRLDLDSFVNAMNLVGDEHKASMFLIMKPGDKRDRWLELQLDTELIPLEVE